MDSTAISIEEEDLIDRSTKKVKIAETSDVNMMNADQDLPIQPSPPKVKASYKDIVTSTEMFDLSPDAMRDKEDFDPPNHAEPLEQSPTQTLHPKVAPVPKPKKPKKDPPRSLEVGPSKKGSNQIKPKSQPKGKNPVPVVKDMQPKPMDPEKQKELKQKEFEMLELMKWYGSQMKEQYLNGGSILDILGGNTASCGVDPPKISNVVPVHPLAPDISTMHSGENLVVDHNTDNQMEVDCSIDKPNPIANDTGKNLKAEKVLKAIGWSGSVRVEAQGFAGGIWCTWKSEDLTVHVVKTSSQCIHLKLLNVGGTTWHLFICYASPQEYIRHSLWEELVAYNSSLTEPWCVMGDFNTVLYDFEKVGGAGANRRAMKAFANCLENYDLDEKKKTILLRLEGIERKLREGPNPFLATLKKELWTEYQSIVRREEEYWFHQSRVNWLNLGDRNTHYYHQATIMRKSRNRIGALQDENQIWIHEDAQLEKLMLEFLKSLYTNLSAGQAVELQE
ncbi:Endonuclease/exonuclease/phosphatase superfamily [Sesbania bispinosa]|nr:Endonuclease/exonuclease/phosphatase superfamily [Sesbania bispinosa]